MAFKVFIGENDRFPQLLGEIGLDIETDHRYAVKRCSCKYTPAAVIIEN